MCARTGILLGLLLGASSAFADQYDLKAAGEATQPGQQQPAAAAAAGAAGIKCFMCLH
jgi:hypothetical protein